MQWYYVVRLLLCILIMISYYEHNFISSESLYILVLIKSLVTPIASYLLLSLIISKFRQSITVEHKMKCHTQSTINLFQKVNLFNAHGFLPHCYHFPVRTISFLVFCFQFVVSFFFFFFIISSLCFGQLSQAHIILMVWLFPFAIHTYLPSQMNEIN